LSTRDIFMLEFRMLFRIVLVGSHEQQSLNTCVWWQIERNSWQGLVTAGRPERRLDETLSTYL
jgi:hypothetical protein